MNNSFLKLIQSPVMRTDHIVRYSGVRQTETEYLSEHVTEITLMSYMIAMKLVNEFNESMNMSDVLEKGLIHDLDEVITGDVPRNTKYYSNDVRTSLEEVAIASVRQISYEMIGSDELVNKWMNAKNGKEGAIIKICDMLCVAKKTMIEVEMYGNGYFLKVAHELRTYLQELLIKLNDILSEFNNKSVSYLRGLISDAHLAIDDLLKDDYRFDKYGLLNNVIGTRQ